MIIPTNNEIKHSYYFVMYNIIYMFLFPYFYYVIINNGIKSISSPPCESSIILKDIC